MFTRRALLTAAAVTVSLATVSLAAIHAAPAMAADPRLDRDAMSALQALYAGDETAKLLGDKAAAILVFPDVVKAGFLVGGQIGKGTLFKGGKATAHYTLASASYGLQIGAQTYGYALFLMTDKAVKYLDQSDGWEVGTGPSLVMVDKGMARTMSSTTLRDDVYAFIFDQKGLMAGIGLQGSKITRDD